MSEKSDKLKQFRMEPSNLRRLKEIQKTYPSQIRVSIGALANLYIAKGIELQEPKKP